MAWLSVPALRVGHATCVQRLESSQSVLSLWRLHCDWLHSHWPLAISSTSSPLLILGGQGGVKASAPSSLGCLASSPILRYAGARDWQLFISIQRDTYPFGILRFWGLCVPRNGYKNSMSGSYCKCQLPTVCSVCPSHSVCLLHADEPSLC